MATHPIVIVGGGFGGLRAAVALSKRVGHRLDTPIYLIDPSPYHIYTPTLYDIAALPHPRVGIVPFEALLAGTHVRFLQERVTHIDLETKHVITEGHRLRYGDLVLAVGSQSRKLTSKNPDGDALLICQTIEDLLDIREEIDRCFAEARVRKDNRCHTHFMVVGGGITGVEFAAGLNHYIRTAAEVHGVSSRGVHVSLLEAGERLVPTLRPAVSKLVERQLKAMGISVLLQTKLTWQGHRRLKLQGETLPKTAVVWTVGSEPHTLVQSLKGLRHDEQGRVLVDGSLQSVGIPGVWVVGDAASALDSGTVDAAIRQGEHVARAILAVRSGALAPAYCPEIEPRTVIQLTPRYGIVSKGKQLLDGYPVIWYKRLKEFRYFSSYLPTTLAVKHCLTGGEDLATDGALCARLGSPKG